MPLGPRCFPYECKIAKSCNIVIRLSVFYELQFYAVCCLQYLFEKLSLLFV